MNYEKKYKESFERARIWQNHLYRTNGSYYANELNYIFPELKESENEKTRKQILSFLKEFEYDHYRNLNFSSWIAWLEKQGEQKTADDVEPKFHKGEWIVFNGLTLYIKEVVNGYYRTISFGGINNSYDWDIDNIARLWTIHDARDGDVLCVKYGNDEMPFIFTGKQHDVAYCALNSFGEFVLSMAEWLLKVSVLPATKEQRDLLFQKMKEFGYVWDSEKKELRKVGQNPTAWSDEDERNMQNISLNLV